MKHRKRTIAISAIMAMMAIIAPASADVEIIDAISREFTVLATTPVEVTDAVSREFTVLATTPVEVTDAVSREFTVFIPKIAEIADAIVPEGIPYAGPAPELIVPDTEATWSLVTGPPGMNIDLSTGVVSWDNPTLAGSPHTITIEADTRGNTAQASWLLTVITSPEIAEIPDQAIPGGTAQYTGPIPELLKGTPPITWSLATGPEGMTINPGNGVVSWSDPTEAGSPHTITIRACNDTCDPPICCDEETWRLTVQTAPVIADIPDETIEELLPYTGPKPELLQSIGPVSWSLVSGPQEMIIDPQTGVVSWLRPLGSLTPYVVTIRVTDATGSDTETWRLTVPISYTAMVWAEVETAPAGTPIYLQGLTTSLSTGEPVPNAAVTIRLRVQGTRRVIQATSNAAGEFGAMFNPLAGEAGHYQIGADHPNVPTDKTDDTFTLYGMRCVPATKTEKLIPGELPKTTEVSLRNLGDTPLTGLQAFVEEAASNLSVQTQVPVELPAHGQSWLRYTVVAMDATVENSTFVIRVTSAEGAVAVLNVNAQVSPLVPHLVATPASVQAAMLRGTQTLVQFEVTNDGGAASEAVSVQIPNVPWMTLATPELMDPIAPGAKRSVVLNLRPGNDLPLGPYNGTIVVSTDVSSVTVPFMFQCLSDRKGDLRVVATDEYTYWADDRPNLAGATVNVSRADDGAEVAVAVTDSTGAVLFSGLTEAYYRVEVTAPDHGTFATQTLVHSGRLNALTAFLPRQMVRYIWTVVPTQIEDEYRVSVQALFETHVPAPVVTIDPAFVDLATLGCDAQINFTITNHGLIAAEAMEIAFANNNSRWEITPLVREIGDLPARSTAVVPVKFHDRACDSVDPTQFKLATYDGIATRDLASPLSPAPYDPCTGPELKANWNLICNVPVPYEAAVSFKLPPSDCGKPGGPPKPPTCVGCGGGGGGEGGPVIFPPVYSSPIFCLPCVPECMMTLITSCLPLMIDSSCTNAGITCANTAFDPTLGSGVECLLGLGECAGLSTAKTIAKFLNPIQKISCVCAVVRDCNCLATGSTGPNPLDGLVCSPFEALDWIYETARDNWSAAPIPLWAASQGGGSNGNVFTPTDNVRRWYNEAMYVYAATYYPFSDSVWLEIPDAQEGYFRVWTEALAQRAAAASENGSYISESEEAELLAMDLPAPVTQDDAHKLIARWNRSLTYEAAGIRNASQVPEGESTDFIEKDLLHTLWTRAMESDSLAMAEGHPSAIHAFIEAIDRLHASLMTMTASGAQVASAVEDPQHAWTPLATNPQESGICARVRIQIDQQAVISRSAFKASLELENGAGNALESIAVTLDVRDGSGTAANDRFGIAPPALTGLSDVDGGGSVAAGTTGKAEWTLIPGDLAAPTEPALYTVGGTLSYSFGDELVTIPLFPVEITVLPNPSLHLKYFLERDVYSDDPFTPEVEPAVPFSLGLLMANTGAGVANNVRITSAQPRIIENEKGLLIDFVIIGTKVRDQLYSPSLTVNLGDVGPGQVAAAQWLMTSSLQGKFIEYSATFEHVNGLNNPQLSIMDSISIHEMIHVVRVESPTDDGQPDFLVNDVSDPDTLPDTLYSSTGDVWPVTAVTDGTISGEVSADRLEVQLAATLPPGWSYLRVDNPASPEFRLAKVLRPDGSEVRIGDNAWTTRRTVRLEGEPPREESLLHLLDHNSPGAYALVYAPTRPPSQADLDGNGTVDGVDWGLFLAALGRSQGAPGYIAAADLDSDGTVTFVDQQLWMAAFRQFIGDPHAVAPAPITLPAYLGDLDGDGDVDAADFGVLQRCYSGRGVSQRTPGCEVARIDGDLDVDLDDLTKLIDCANGPAIPPPDRCRR